MAMQNDEKKSTDHQYLGCLVRVFEFLVLLVLIFVFYFLESLLSSALSSLNVKDDRVFFYLAVGSMIVSIIGLVVSIITLIATVLAWLFPGKIPDILKILMQRKIAHRSTVKQESSQKPRYFISYHQTDERLAMKEVIKPLEEEGKKKGFSIQYWSWSGRTNYEQEMARADRVAKRTLTIFTPHYQEKLQYDHAWMDKFRERNEAPGNGVAILIVDCELGPELEKIEIIDLTEGETSADRVRRLLTSLSGELEITSSLRPDQLKADPPASQNIPYPYDKFFTGREEILEDIYKIFDQDERTRSRYPQAITGLSGMGKTKTAVEYAYRYAGRYRVIVWIDVSVCDDVQSIRQKISSQLKKPENVLAEKQEDSIEASESMPAKPMQDPNGSSPTPDSVKKLLKEHERWLLVLDKCEDPGLVRKIISSEEGIVSPDGKGDILLTTSLRRISSDVSTVTLKKGLEPEEGALFLLRKSEKIKLNDSLDIAISDDREEAKKISEAMDGFPLGLEHAGAYIKSGVSLKDYRGMYQTKLTELFTRLRDLDFSGSGFSTEGFTTIATTWSITIQKLKGEKPFGPIAAELLRFCAFLSDDAVPEEIIKNAPDHGRVLKDIADQIVFDAACGELDKYSLIERTDGTLRVHRVVQAVIREGMLYGDTTDRDIKELAERAVMAVNAVLPDIDFAGWQCCPANTILCALICSKHIDKQRRKQILSCAATCIEHIKRWNLRSLEDMRLLYRMAHYRLAYGQYKEAEEPLEQLLKIHEEASGKKFPGLAKLYCTLEEVYRMQGKFVQAGECLRKALENNPSQAEQVVINHNLGRLYEDRGDWNEQERMGHYGEAEGYYEKALGTREENYERSLQTDALKKEYRLDEAVITNDLAGVYLKQTREEQTRPEEKFKKPMRHYLQALETFNELLGADHPLTVQCRVNLATLCIAADQIIWDRGSCTMQYRNKGYRINPEQDYKNILKASREFLGDDHPQVVVRLANLAELYRWQDQPDASERHYREAVETITIKKEAFQHPRYAYVMRGYADLLDQKYPDGSKKLQIESLREDADEILNAYRTDSTKSPEPQNKHEEQAGKNKSYPVMLG